jgi:hypothetical protein
MKSIENINNTLNKPSVNEKEGDGFTETMRKIAKTPLGKTLLVLGASMTFFGANEVNAQEDYKVNPEGMKTRIEQLKQDRAKKIIKARNDIRDTIQDCSLLENPDGTSICKFTANGVKLEATWSKNNHNEDRTSSGPTSVPGPKIVPGPTSVPGPKSVSMSEWGK